MGRSVITVATKAIVAIAGLQAGCALLAGCEDEPVSSSSPTTTPAAQIEIDRQHVATLRGDIRLAIPNLLFVIQHDPAGGDWTGLTLLSTKPGLDGSRLVFGTSQNLASPTRLVGTAVHLGGGRLLDVRGNGVFTRTTVYQPKFATMEISKLTETEATGTIKGEFYRFRVASPLIAPAVVNLEIDFVAAVTIR